MRQRKPVISAAKHISGRMRIYTDRLKEIHVPALICSGTDDLCTPLVAKTMYDRIPDSRWQLFANARHMCFVDQHDMYCKILSAWMREHD